MTKNLIINYLKELKASLYYLQVVFMGSIVIGIAIVLPLAVGSSIGEKQANQKFMQEHGEFYETIAKEWLPEVENMRSGLEISGIEITVLREDIPECTICYHVSETAIEYSYENVNIGVFSMLCAGGTLIVWIMFLVVVWFFLVSPIIKKIRKRD